MKKSDQTSEKKESRRNIQERFRLISSDLQQYVEKRIELVQLEIADRLSMMVARSIHKLLGMAFMVLSYVFFMVALAQYLGTVLGNPSLGYLIVAGVTGVVGLVLASVKPEVFSRQMRRSWFKQVFAASPSRSTADKHKGRAKERDEPEHEESSESSHENRN